MARHIEAWMDGVALSSLGPYLIQGVQEDPAEVDAMATPRLGMDGQWPGVQRRTALRVVILVAIRELYDLGRRSMLAETLAGWARGSILQLSNHPERRLRVRCTGWPSVGAARSYTEELRVELTAWTPPYWEDQQPARLTLTGDQAEGSIRLPGTARAPIAVTVTPTSALTDFAVTVGGQTITLEELAVPAGEQLLLTRDDEDNLQITSGGVSLMRRRTPASADDLYCEPGAVAVSYGANVNCEVLFEARGRWI